MRISKLFFFLMPLVVVIGCQGASNHAEKQDQSDIISSKRKEIEKKYSPILSCDSTIINNEFSFDVLAFEVFKADTTKVKSLFLDPVVLKSEKQKNSENGSYYLYDFTDGVNKLILYNNNGFYLEEGDIKSDKVLLNKKISIGMLKEDFLKLIKGTNTKCDTINAVNDDSTFETVYIFNNSKLKQIKMGQIVE